MWAQIIAPGQTVTLDIPDDANMYITNVCIPKIPEGTKSVPQRLLAHIITIDPYQEEDQVDVSKLPHIDIMISALVPGEKEHEVVNFCFSPLNIVKLYNQGTCEMHISGYNVPIDEEEDQEEDEEEINEKEASDDSPDDSPNNDVDEVDEIDVQTKLLALSKNKPKSSPAQKPPPPPPHKQQQQQMKKPPPPPPSHKPQQIGKPKFMNNMKGKDFKHGHNHKGKH